MVSVTVLKPYAKTVIDGRLAALETTLAGFGDFDPDLYSTTAQIETMLTSYVPKTRVIASGNGVKINSGASASLAATVTVSLDFATQAESEAGLLSNKPMHALGVAQAIAAQAPRRGAIGDFGMHGGTTPPTGALVRDGSAVSRTVYPELFAVTGTAYGAGDGSTTFNLPDGRGRVDRGDDLGAGRDTGRVHGTAQDDAIGAHSHTFSVWAGTGMAVAQATGAGTETGTQSTSSVGGGETRMKNLSGLPIIWAY